MSTATDRETPEGCAVPSARTSVAAIREASRSQAREHPGGSNNSHRLIRRGMPYGPAYDPNVPYDGIERGLLGYFINSYIENQYEFVLKEWMRSG